MTHLVSHQEATDQCISSIADSYYLLRWENKEEKIKSTQTTVRTQLNNIWACHKPALLNYTQKHATNKTPKINQKSIWQGLLQVIQIPPPLSTTSRKALLIIQNLGLFCKRKSAVLLEPFWYPETPLICQLPKIPTQSSLWSVGQGLVLVVWCLFGGGGGLLSWQSLVREALQQRKTWQFSHESQEVTFFLLDESQKCHSFQGLPFSFLIRLNRVHQGRKFLY